MQAKNKNGWIPDRPDIRDIPVSTKKVKNIYASADLRRFCSPVEDQGEIGSCTAHAVIGLLEMIHRLKEQPHVDLSRLFLYKVTRNLLGWKGDQGAYIRTAIKAAIMIGAPQERYWPYNTKKFDEEPSQFTYALASNFRGLTYLNVGLSRDPNAVLASVKTTLSKSHPIAFGFSVFDTINDETGEIGAPTSRSKAEGGHAVLAVGYDDTKVIGSNRGAILIRNSWGKSWGEDGYGWLPYFYVQHGLADDFWTITDAASFRETEFDVMDK